MHLALLAVVCALSLGLAACADAPRSAGSDANPLDAVPPASPDTPARVVTLLTAEQAKEMMDAGGVTILDVRTEQEFAEGHIPSAVNIPNESIQEAPPAALTDKNAVLMVYCRSGRRSAQAAERLVALGYENVYDFGGILDWPYEVTTN